MIGKRLSEISCDEEEFNKSKTLYEDALQRSGFNTELKFTPTTGQPARRRRRRNKIWFNPPFCKTVKTNVGKIFLKLLDKHFPHDHMFHKIFNRNTVRISYCCLDNVAQKISKHNKKILHPPKIDKNNKNDTRQCNCRPNGSPCPLGGECLESTIVYKAKVASQGEAKHYYGSCATTFKTRLGTHKRSFNVRSYNQTTLSKYLWELKDRKVDYTLSWEIAAHALPYQCSAPRCYLCLSEKRIIAMADPSTCLNQKTELISKCRHKNKFMLGQLGEVT